MDSRGNTMRIRMQGGEIVGSGNVSRERQRTSDGREASQGPKRYECPHCGVVLETDEPIEGTRVACPECGKEFVAAHGNARKKKPKLKAMCPHCSTLNEIAPSDAGTYLDCRVCGKRFRARKISLLSPSLSMKPSLVCMGIVAVLVWLPDAMGDFFLQEEAMVVLALALFLSGIVGSVFLCKLHYNCWQAIPAKFARMTPGKAVGFLFIPVFHLYWIFPSIAGLGADCAMLARRKGLDGFDHLKTLGLVHALAVLCLPVLAKASGYEYAKVAVIACLVSWGLFYRGVTQLFQRLAETGGDAPSGE